LAKYTFLNMAEDVLASSKEPMDVASIWTKSLSDGLADRVGSQGKTPWMTLAARLYVDSKENLKSRFFRVGQNPVRFGLIGKHKVTQIAEIALRPIEAPSKIKERHLHPLVAFFAKLYMDGMYVKTIFHEKSSKKSFAEWLHPDLVGVRFPELNSDALELATIVGEHPIKLCSFELKLSLGFSNLRESFFQAVSNSSWAHQGYLVASDIHESLEFHAELKRLSSSFGIGVISLDADNPEDSSILFPATERDSLDWESVNKLASQNPDFSQFLRDVRIDLEGKKVHPAEYDKIETDLDKLKILINSGVKK
jgi:uncharacterized protein